MTAERVGGQGGEEWWVGGRGLPVFIMSCGSAGVTVDEAGLISASRSDAENRPAGDAVIRPSIILNLFK